MEEMKFHLMKNILNNEILSRKLNWTTQAFFTNTHSLNQWSVWLTIGLIIIIKFRFTYVSLKLDMSKNIFSGFSVLSMASWDSHQCTNEYSNIFEYFPPNIDIRIQFVAIFKAEYYSNIRIILYEYFRILVFKNHLKYLK